MTIAYQVSHEYGEYSHGEVIVCSTNLEESTKFYNQAIAQCIEDGEDNHTDYICIEQVEVTLDEDGDVDEVIEIGDLIVEHVFNEPPEN